MHQTWLLFGAAFGLAHGIDIPAVPSWPSGECTDKSLTIPSWIVSNFTSGSDGSSSFSVTNRAADTSAEVTCDSSACTVSGGATLSASVSSGPVVTLTESWTCSDNDVSFAATGSVAITSVIDGESPIPYLAYGSLTAPVSLTPTQPTPPAGYDASTCADVSSSPLWTITDVSFQNYTVDQCIQWYNPGYICLNPGTPWHAKGQFLNVTVANAALGYSTTCSLTISSDPTSVSSETVRCEGGDFGEIALDITWTGSQPDFTITIDQLWYCLEDPTTNAYPSVIVATGSTDVSLSCSSVTGITGAAGDIITSCTLAQATLDGTLVESEQEDEFALVTALPVTGGCTSDSVVKAYWLMHDPLWQTKSVVAGEADQLWEWSSKLSSPAFTGGYWFYVFIGQAGLSGGDDPTTWYDCAWSLPGDSGPPCQIQFDYSTRELALNLVWECSDKDAANPLYWHTNATTTLSDSGMSCANDNPNITTCSYHSGYDVTLAVPDLQVEVTLTE